MKDCTHNVCIVAYLLRLKNEIIVQYWHILVIIFHWLCIVIAVTSTKEYEKAITAARQIGRGLHASLDLEERKSKLEETVEKLQQEIEMVSAVRDEHQKSLKNFSTAAQKEAIMARIDKANDKLQVRLLL